MSEAFQPVLRRSPSGPRVDFQIDTDDVENNSTVPGASVTDALDTIFARKVNYLDQEDSPIGLWNFDDTLASVVGPDFSTTTGPYAFCDAYPGIRGLDVGIGTRIESPTGLPLTGNMSLEVLILMDTNPTNQWVIGCGGLANGAAANNVTYALVLPTTNPPRNVQAFWESGGGVDRGFATPLAAGSPSLPPVHNLFQLGFSRTGVSAQIYMNGRPFGVLTSGVAAATGGGGGILTIGGRHSALSSDQFQLISAAVYDRSRDAAEWKASYNRSIGNGLGFLT